MKPSKELKKAYEAGQNWKGMSIDELYYAQAMPYEVINPLSADDEVIGLFWWAGQKGFEMPAYVKGLRYGEAPESGKSYNHREQCLEAGVSMIEIETENGEKIKTQDNLSLLFSNMQERGEYKYGGWLHFETGGDGEPLIVNAERIID